MTMLVRLSELVVGTCACLGAIGTALADAQRATEFQVGAGIAYMPYYSGARGSGPRARIWADGTFPTSAWGTFYIDSGSLTIDPELRWDIVDSLDLGGGILVGYRAGRDDSVPKFTSANDGSSRLTGLANVAATIDAGLAGHAIVFGVPLFAQVRSALNGAQGTLVNLGLFLPASPLPTVEIVVLPTLSWADARQMRAFYGVSPVESSASGFSVYSPGAGWENAAIELGADWKAGEGWHVVGSLAYQRLLGNAAASPLVQTRNQTSAFAGLARSF